jgi:hypothetical protein
MFMVTALAHWPASGVKVYVLVPAVKVLMAAGFQVPVTAGLLVELAGNAGGVEFWQRGPMGVKVGVISVVMTISMVTALAHWPASGVKVYVLVPAVKVLMAAGFQKPVTAGLLVELVGSRGGVEFWQRGPMGVKVGVISVVMTISMVTALAHCPGAGVKVYVVVPFVAVLMVAGLQVPVTAGLLVELAGKAGGVEFWQRGPMGVKVGVISVVMTMSMVTALAHCPAVGVKV